MNDAFGDPVPHVDLRSERLHALAARHGWSAATALDWDALSFERSPPPVRSAMTELYADVLYAESFGVGVTDRMVTLAPEGTLRDFARTQLADETRHVDFFERILTKLGRPEKISAGLVSLHELLGDIHDYDELMLHAQVVETAAQTLFVTNAKRTLRMMDRGIRLPGSDAVRTLVSSVAAHVGRDESRHIAFGFHYLSGRLLGLDAATRHGLEERIVLSARAMYGAFAERQSIFSRLGVAPDVLLAGVWAVLRRQFERLGLDIGTPPSEPLPESRWP